MSTHHFRLIFVMPDFFLKDEFVGKTYLAKAVATEAKSTFFSISSSDMISKWQGESERLVKTLFRVASESPGGAIIFIDEVDSLLSSRKEGEDDSVRKVKCEFLIHMDGLDTDTKANVLVLGATNVPWELDVAARRRFATRVYIPLPDAKARSAMFKIHLVDTSNILCDDDFEKLGQETEGFSGSDIKRLVREALLVPLRQCMQAQHFKLVDGSYIPWRSNCSSCPKNHRTCQICGATRMQMDDIPKPLKLKRPYVLMDHFKKALKTCHPSVSDEYMREYDEKTKQFGQDGK